jgi:phasin
MEKIMTTEFNSVLNSFQSAFAPVTDALKNLQANIEVPEAARDFVKRSANTAKERVAEIHTNASEVTGAIESAVAGSISETAKITRNIQQAMHDDAHAFFASLDKLASAKSFGEAVQIQSELIRSRSEVAAARAKSASEYVSQLFADGAKTVTKTAQDNLAKVASFNRELA